MDLFAAYICLFITSAASGFKEISGRMAAKTIASHMVCAF